MNKRRSINTKFWDDNFVVELTPEEKLLFLYLLTNSLCNILGIYEISIKRICFDTGLSFESISKALKGFERHNKIKYVHGYVIIYNFLKNQALNSNMEKGAVQIYNNLPNELKNKELGKPLKAFQRLSKPFKSFQILPKPFKAFEKEKENKKNKIFSADVQNLFEFFIQNFPVNTHPKNDKQKFEWLNCADKLINKDKYTMFEIKEIVQKFRADDFWGQNFQSPLKLRVKNKENIKYIDFFKNKLDGNIINREAQSRYNVPVCDHEHDRL